jgi:UDP-glucuronate decarboxylase
MVSTLRGEPLPIFGSGDQTRSFCYVDDLIEGLIAPMNAPDAVTRPIRSASPMR